MICVRGLACFVFLVACFNPTYHDPTCGPGGACPAGLTCVDGTCRRPDMVATPDACVGLGCAVVDCAATGRSPTTITGRVFAPNGTLPLYGIDVYVPNEALPPPVDMVVCDRCGTPLPGAPIVQAVTDVDGRFTLTDVPAGADIPLVISSGKWRREITIPSVAECATATLAASETRLPRDRTEGHLPRIAVSTGVADALECLIRKIGIADSEIGTATGVQRVHLYADTASQGVGATNFAAGFPGGSGAFADSATLWGDLDRMKTYDLLVFSCEGAQYLATKPKAAMDAVKAYADMGGRLLVDHWHNIWIDGATQAGGGSPAPDDWPSIAECGTTSMNFTTPPVVIDEINNPIGTPFANWLVSVAPGLVRGQIPIAANSGRQTCTSIDPSKALRWTTWMPAGTAFPQVFEIPTPVLASPQQRCGKVVFSDMHASPDSSSNPGSPFPSQCAPSQLSPQELALVFMIFDLTACI